MKSALLRKRSVRWRAAVFGSLMVAMMAGTALAQERIPIKVGNRSGQDLFVSLYDHICAREVYRGLLQSGGQVLREYCTGSSRRASISVLVLGSNRIRFNDVRAHKVIWLRLSRHGVQQGR